ncbi:MAG: formylglycine-generating enzyme family protein [Planctomycetota bacterium]|jgi:formylglycine-generating enzyme required for sulfatase activity
MPRCISCNEVYADQLRRCPHCGDRPEGHRPDQALAPAKAEQPKTSLGYAARRKRMRLAVLALIGAGVALAVSVGLPAAPDPRDEVTAYKEGAILDEGMFDRSPLTNPDEIKAAPASEGWQVVSVSVVGADVHVEGTCSPDAVWRVLVNGRPAVISPRGDRFRAVVPIDTGIVEVVGEGLAGDRATLSSQVIHDDTKSTGRGPMRLLSHAEGATVHDALVRLTVAPMNGSGSNHMESVVLREVENRVTVEETTFALYRAPRGFKFLRVTPQGTYTFLREKDGQEMVLLPGGLAWRGRGEQPPDGPRHLVRLSPYLLDRTEVTCGQYSAFLRAVGENDLSMRLWDDPGVVLRPVGWTSDVPPAGLADRPVVGIAWYAAYAYARWVGGRLPTEAEWERAAAGANGLTYPWGEEFHPAHCRARANGAQRADSLPAGVSAYGLLHMSGNVREWCVDRYDPRWYVRGARINPRGPAGPAHRVVRGGSFRSTPAELVLQHRDNMDPTEKAADLGFRVARAWVDLDDR